MSKPVYRSLLAALGLSAVMTAPALAQAYDCNIRQRSWAGLISEAYRFEIDAERGQALVLDPIIRFALGKSAKGGYESLADGAQKVMWEVEDVPIAPEGGPTDARFEAVLTEGEHLEVQLSATWSDGSEAGTGKGRCTLAE